MKPEEHTGGEPQIEATTGAPVAVTTGLAEEATPKDEKRWAKVLVIAGGGRIPSGEKRAVIVTEYRGDVEFNEDGSHKTEAPLKTSGYAAGADLYYRTDSLVDFPAGSDVLTLGDNVRQGGFGGFNNSPGFVNVGPTSAAYAAINLAIHRGAEEIEVVGLTSAQKTLLEPWLGDRRVIATGAKIDIGAKSPTA